MTRSTLWSLSRGAFLTAVLLLPSGLRAQTPEGIKIHGAWVIEVRNANGSVASRRAFENALDIYGKRDLAAFLSRSNPVAFWRVIANVSTGMCASAAGYCQISEPTDNLSSGGIPISRNLTVTGADVEVILRGSFVAVADGTIGSVMTINMRDNTAAGPFTQTALGTPISVQATQTVAVSVTFSFQ